MTRRAVILQALASTPADIDRLGRGLNPVAVAWRPHEAAWAPGEIIEHLLVVEALYCHQFQRIIAENIPLIPTLHPTSERGEPVWPAAAEMFRQARQATLTLLQGLAPGEWQRTAVDETNRPITLRFLAQSLVEHDIEHTNQLVETVQAWRRLATYPVVAAGDLNPGR